VIRYCATKFFMASPLSDEVVVPEDYGDRGKHVDQAIAVITTGDSTLA